MAGLTAVDASRPLFERWPRLRESTPIVPIGTFPTPVQRAAALGKAWGAEIWVKRDDVTGTVFGGNKVRKLEFLLAAAKAHGAPIWAYAVTGSNWAVAVALYGRQFGIPVDLHLFRRPMNPWLERNLALAQSLARQTTISRTVLSVPIQGAARWLRGRFIMPPGGSSVLSTLGYVNAGLELAEQVRRGDLPAPDIVVAALGTGGTLAGILGGLRAGGLDSRVLGIRVSDRIVSNATLTARLARRTMALLARRAEDPGAAIRFGASDFAVRHDFIGGGYGVPTPAGGEAAREFAELEGLKAESTYTAKALAGLKALAPSFPQGARVLFWLTCNSRPTENLRA